MNQAGTILSVQGLETHFMAENGVVRAVDGVSFEVKRGETLGIVGESGSGKTVASLSILRLISSADGKIAAGKVMFDGKDILDLPLGEVQKLRGKRIAMIFQDPMTSLNPFRKISSQLMEVTRLHLGHTRSEALDHAVDMLGAVGIPQPEQRIHNYPHQFSGGMRQRVMIAMALSCSPELLIADEPTTALDATIQAQVLDVIKDTKVKMEASVILITHDLGIAATSTDRIIVMYAGRILEEAPTSQLFSTPANPYTKGLLKCVPDPRRKHGKSLYQIRGQAPDMTNLPPGCAFEPRCDRAEDICRREIPKLVEVDEGHRSRCHFAVDVYAESVGPHRAD